MNYSFVECGKLHNKTPECFFPLAPTAIASPWCFSFVFTTPHLHLKTIPAEIMEQCGTFIQGWVDTEYTLLSFGCSLDEFFLENKIMKTIRSLNTGICVTLFPCNPFHFTKAGPCVASSRRSQPGGTLPSAGLHSSGSVVIRVPEVHLNDRSHRNVAALASLLHL